jgi:SAM-dependent methyltransferase
MRSETCPICDGATIARPAAVASFLVERCQLDTARTNVRFCAACEFAFFERRLTPAEAAALYKDYRGPAYDAQRLRHEPSYAPHIPHLNDPMSEYYRGRIRDLADVMSILPEINPPAVLDFGGDGSIAKRLFPAAEVSFLDSSAGEVLLRDRFPLIFASQVFEHLSEPREAMAQIVERLDDDGLVLLDLPRDYAGPLYEAFFWQEKHGGPLNQMHEHINHFSSRASRRLLELSGLEPVFEVDTPALPLTLMIAGRPGSAVLNHLREVAPVRRLHWSADRLRDRVAADQARSARQLAELQAAVKTLTEQLAAARREIGAVAARLPGQQVPAGQQLPPAYRPG